MKKQFLYLVILSSIGCSSPKQVFTESETSKLIPTKDPLEGSWILKNVLMGDALDASCGFANVGKVKEMNLTLTSEKGFSGDIKKMFGQSSVNDFTGEYTVLSYDEKSKTGKIEFSPLMSTKMAALDPTLMECESRYFSYLQKSEDFKIEGGKLQLSNTYPLAKGDSGNSPFDQSYKNVLYLEKK